MSTPIPAGGMDKYQHPLFCVHGCCSTRWSNFPKALHAVCGLGGSRAYTSVLLPGLSLVTSLAFLHLLISYGGKRWQKERSWMPPARGIIFQACWGIMKADRPSYFWVLYLGEKELVCMNKGCRIWEVFSQCWKCNKNPYHKLLGPTQDFLVEPSFGQGYVEGQTNWS